MDKLRATRLFKECRLEGIPTVIYAAWNPRPTAARIAACFGDQVPLMLRTSAEGEIRNLPRKAGVDAGEASEWIARLPSDLSILVQPYSEVVFSVELAIYPACYVAEVVPGIWELDSQVQPAVLTLYPDAASIRLEWHLQAAPAKFHSARGGYSLCPAQVEDWQVAALVAWLRQQDSGLATLADRCGRPCGVKIHYAEDYGLSPQNVRTNVPPPAFWDPEAQAPGSWAILKMLDDSVPTDRPILLDVSVARERATDIVVWAAKLRAARVETIYVQFGLLSHLAIGLREAGLIVRRVDDALLRD
jgi:hypothetical protein